MNRTLKILAILVSIFFLVSGCSKVSKDRTDWIDEVESQAFSDQPYVEGFFEYLGPDEKWSGPQTLMIHVSARVEGAAMVAVHPDIFVKKVYARATAEEIRKERKENGDGGVSDEQRLPSRAMRERLARLAYEVQKATATLGGCLYPVRARMLRVDGVIIERVGCRGQDQWTTLTSEFAADLILAYLQGVTRRPASVPRFSKSEDELSQTQRSLWLPKGLKPERVQILPNNFFNKD